MRVSEIFRSIQGEGPFSGRIGVFLRTFGCNLGEKCGLYEESGCDSEYAWKETWRKDEYEEMSCEEVSKRMKRLFKSGDLCIFSGGEPLLHKDELFELKCDYLYLTKFSKFIVETNGSIVPDSDWQNTWWSISPHSVIDYQRWKEFDNVYWKFVCSGPEDFDWVNDIVEVEDLDPRNVWLMPEGYMRLQLQENRRAVVEEAIKNGYNYSDRLQIQIWGNMRGT